MAHLPVRIYFNNEPANEVWRQSLQEITVEASWGRPTEARLLFPIAADARGTWLDLAGEGNISSGQRVRLEVSPDGEKVVPIIDGEIIRVESRQSAEPGASLRVWVVRDDSEIMNRDEGVWVFEKENAGDAAKALYQELGSLFADVTLENSHQFQSPAPQQIAHRGTRWELLRKLSKTYGVEAFVRPGKNKGTSIGFFCKVPRSEDRCADVWINGADCNLLEVELLDDFQQAALVQSQNMTLQQKQRYDHRADPGTAGRVQLTAHELGQAAEATTFAEAEMERLKRGVLLRAKVRQAVYEDVFATYAWVRVGGTGVRYAGDYLVHRVFHRFFNGQWEQEVGLMGIANEKRQPPFAPAGRIF